MYLGCSWRAVLHSMFAPYHFSRNSLIMMFLKMLGEGQEHFRNVTQLAFFFLFLWGIQIWMAEMTTVLFPTALLLLYCSTYCWTVYVVLLLCWLMCFSVKLRPFVFVASSTVHSLHSRHLLVLSLSKDVERLSYWCALNHVFYFNRAQLWSLGTRWKILCGTIINILKYFQKWRQHI